MKVKDLIKKLKKLDQNKEAVIPKTIYREQKGDQGIEFIEIESVADSISKNIVIIE